MTSFDAQLYVKNRTGRRTEGEARDKRDEQGGKRKGELEVGEGRGRKGEVGTRERECGGREVDEGGGG